MAQDTALQALLAQSKPKPAGGGGGSAFDAMMALQQPDDATVLGGVGEAGRNIARGLGDVAGSLLQTQETVRKGLRHLGHEVFGLPEGDTLLDTLSPGKLLSRAGGALKEALPKPNPAYSGGLKGFVTQDVPAGLGSMAGFMLSAGAGGVPAVAMVGMATSFVGGYEEMAQRQDVSENDKWLYAVMQGGMGASEAVPIAGMLARLNKRTGGGVRKVLWDMAAEGFEEAGQEGAQKLWGDFMRVALTPDEYREFSTELKDLAYSMAVGAVSGAGASGAISILAGRMGHEPPPLAPQDGSGPLQGPAVPFDPANPTDGQREALDAAYEALTSGKAPLTPDVAAAIVAAAQAPSLDEQAQATRLGSTILILNHPEGKPLPMEGSARPGTRTILIDGSLDPQARRGQVLAHELYAHFAAEVAPEEFATMQAELRRDHRELWDAFREYQLETQKAAGYPIETPEAADEEATATAAEFVPSFTRFLLDGGERSKELTAAIDKAAARSPIVQKILDLLIRAAQKLGASVRTVAQQLQQLADEIGTTSLEKQRPGVALDFARRFAALADVVAAKNLEPGVTVAAPKVEVAPAVEVEDAAPAVVPTAEAEGSLQAPPEPRVETTTDQGPAAMPTEPSLFGEVERQLRPRVQAAGPTVTQPNLIDIQPGDLPGQRSLLDDDAGRAKARSDRAKDRIERKKAKMQAGETTLRDFIASQGGLEYSEEAWMRFSKKETGEKSRIGIGFPVKGKGKGGMSVQDAVTAAINEGFFPGRDYRDIGLDELLEAMESDVSALNADELSLAMDEERWRREQEMDAYYGEQGDRFSIAPPTDSDAFKRWFGDSKVVDGDGKPLVVYHGTHAPPFVAFDPDDLDLTRNGYRLDTGLGVFFTTATREANFFIEEEVDFLGGRDAGKYSRGSRIIPAYLSIANPKEYPSQAELLADLEDADYHREGPGVALYERLEAEGYDGVYIAMSGMDGPGTGGEWYVAFSATQIKSAIGNSGAFDGANPDIRFSIPGETPTFAAKDEARLEAVERAILDQFNSLTRVQRDVQAAGRGVAEDADAALAAKLFPGKSSEAAGRAKTLANKLKALIRLAGLDLTTLDDYLRAMHAPQRNALMAERHPKAHNTTTHPGSGADSQGVPLSDAHAAEIVADVESSPKAAQYKKAAAIVRQAYDLARQMRVDYGLLSESGKAAWEEAFGPDYVSLRSEELEEGGPPWFVKPSGFQLPSSLSKRAEGRSSTSGSPTAWAFEQFEAVALLAHKNRVSQTVAKLVEENPNSELWELRDEETGGEALGTSHQLRYYKDGEKRYIVFHGENGALLAQALKRLGGQDASVVARLVGPISRLFTALATRFNPEFLFRNAAKDIQTAAARVGVTLSAAEGASLPGNAAKAMRGAMRVMAAERKGEEVPTGYWEDLFKKWREAGGQTGWADHVGYEERVKAFMDMKSKGRIVDALRVMTSAFLDAQDGVEAGTRVATFAAAMRSGMSEGRAAAFSRDVTVDFNRKGELSPAINALYWFFNPSIQGTRMVMKTVATKKGALMASSLVGLSYAVAMYNRWIGDDDDHNRADEMSAWQKNAYFTLLLPDSYTIPTPGGEGFTIDRLSVPIGWGYNVFWALGQQIADVVHGPTTSTEALAAVVTAATEAFSPMGSSPTFGQFVSPSLLDPIVQVSENTRWSGSAIMPEGYGTRPDSHLAWPDSPQALKTAMEQINSWTGGSSRRSGAIDISPETIEYLAKSYTSGAGTFAVNTGKTLLALVTGGKLPSENIPVLRSFAGEPNVRAVGGQFTAAMRDVEATAGEMGDGEAPTKPALARLINTAKAYKKVVRKLRDAGRDPEVLQRQREFLSLYRAALESQ